MVAARQRFDALVTEEVCGFVGPLLVSFLESAGVYPTGIMSLPFCERFEDDAVS